jgi:hypothetical protein
MTVSVSIYHANEKKQKRYAMKSMTGRKCSISAMLSSLEREHCAGSNIATAGSDRAETVSPSRHGR